MKVNRRTGHLANTIFLLKTQTIVVFCVFVCSVCSGSTMQRKVTQYLVLPTQTFFADSTHKHMVRTNIGEVTDKENHHSPFFLNQVNLVSLERAGLLIYNGLDHQYSKFFSAECP